MEHRKQMPSVKSQIILNIVSILIKFPLNLLIYCEFYTEFSYLNIFHEVVIPSTNILLYIY